MVLKTELTVNARVVEVQHLARKGVRTELILGEAVAGARRLVHVLAPRGLLVLRKEREGGGERGEARKRV